MQPGGFKRRQKIYLLAHVMHIFLEVWGGGGGWLRAHRVAALILKREGGKKKNISQAYRIP